MRGLILLTFLFFQVPSASALFGEELAPLFELVAGQIQEIERLTEQLGVAKDQQNLLIQLNSGIEKTVTQIRTLQSILERSQGLDPKEVKSISDLNDLLTRVKDVKSLIDSVIDAKIDLAEQAISKSSLQGDTTYKMGQEMISTGSQLAQESQTASPGRANQINAAASSAQMVSQGVQLQTLAQIVQLQALQLEFQKTELEQRRQLERLRRGNFERELFRQTNRKGVRK
ncbi:MAG: hypothetical protein AB7F66_13495 [Bacteriovoracia bacterium]